MSAAHYMAGVRVRRNTGHSVVAEARSWAQFGLVSRERDRSGKVAVACTWVEPVGGELRLLLMVAAA